MNLLKNCWQRRWFRSLVLTSASIGTGYGLLCAGVNRSGARQLNATLAMIKAEGETLDFRAVCKEPVPESENFCAIPLLKDIALVLDKDLSKGVPGEKRWRLEELKLPERSPSGTPLERPKQPRADLGTLTDLEAWADWLREAPPETAKANPRDAAREVLTALAKHDPIIQELAAGLNRPHARWTPEWKTRAVPKSLWNIALTHNPSAQAMSQTLTLRAVAAARAGEVHQAHEAALIAARLNEAAENDPFLIGTLVQSAGTMLLCGSIWEFCHAHTGTPEDFAKLEDTLSRIDFRRSGLNAMRGEMVFMFNSMHFAMRNRSELFGLLKLLQVLPQKTRQHFVLAAMPAGVLEANAAVLAELEMHYLVKPLRDHGLLTALHTSEDLEARLEGVRSNPWRHPSFLLASVAIPTVSTIFRKLAYTEAITAQAVIACALERHRIETGEYPETLDSLKRADRSPLPPDVMTGQPMCYRRETNGRYTLWSVGFDVKDDGGKRNLDRKNAEATRFHNPDYVGDWVWDFPAR